MVDILILKKEHKKELNKVSLDMFNGIHLITKIFGENRKEISQDELNSLSKNKGLRLKQILNGLSWLLMRGYFCLYNDINGKIIYELVDEKQENKN